MKLPVVWSAEGPIVGQNSGRVEWRAGFVGSHREFAVNLKFYQIADDVVEVVAKTVFECGEGEATLCRLLRQPDCNYAVAHIKKRDSDRLGENMYECSVVFRFCGIESYKNYSFSALDVFEIKEKLLKIAEDNVHAFRYRCETVFRGTVRCEIEWGERDLDGNLYPGKLPKHGSVSYSELFQCGYDVFGVVLLDDNLEEAMTRYFSFLHNVRCLSVNVLNGSELDRLFS